MKPSTRQANVTGEIEDLLKQGDIREAATLAIASLGSSDNEVSLL